MKTISFLSVIFFLSFIATAQETAGFSKNLDAFLSTYVKDGKVDYAGIQKDPKQLQHLIDLTNDIKIPVSRGKEYQAFWINAYNLHVIDGLVVKYPTKSPLDIVGFFDKTKRSVSGEKLTLNDIENKKLRAQFKDARFHFVLVCGAIGCPPLISKSYKPEILEIQLETQTQLAINNPSFIKMKGDKLSISQIFEWYKEDFDTSNTTTLSFINSYLKIPVSDKAKISYYNYDWNINKL